MVESESITLRLSEVVFEYPELYDIHHIDHNNKRKKEDVWEVIGSRLSMPGQCQCCTIITHDSLFFVYSVG